MTENEIYKILTETGLPVTYDHWNEKDVPALPYLVYRYPAVESIPADDGSRVSVADLDVELYTDTKEPETEKAVEAVFHDYGIIYNKTERYISSERLYETLYETEVILDGQDSIWN